MVSKTGIASDKKEIEAITNWPIPVTVTDERSFLGFTNYYKWFMPRYAHTGGSRLSQIFCVLLQALAEPKYMTTLNEVE